MLHRKSKNFRKKSYFKKSKISDKYPLVHNNSNKKFKKKGIALLISAITSLSLFCVSWRSIILENRNHSTENNIFQNYIYKDKKNSVTDSIYSRLSIYAYIINLANKEMMYSDSVTVDSIPLDVGEDSLKLLLDGSLDKVKFMNRVLRKVDSLTSLGYDVGLSIVISIYVKGDKYYDKFYFELSGSDAIKKRGIEI